MRKKQSNQPKQTKQPKAVAPVETTFYQKVKTVSIYPKNKNQRIFLKQLQDDRKSIIFAIGHAGCGKTYLSVQYAIKQLQEGKIQKIVITRPAVSADEDIGFLPGPQPLDAKILTPTGWTTMGKLAVGDLVIGRDGTPTPVLGIYPKGEKMVYKITTTDGTSTEACEDHLWITRTLEDRKRNREGTIKSTNVIMDTLINKNGKLNHILPRNEAVQFTKQDLPIPPYTLGALLGDGCMTQIMCICNTDNEIISKVNDELEQIGCRVVMPSAGISHRIRGDLQFNKPAHQVFLKDIISGDEIGRYESTGLAAKAIGVNKTTIYSRCKASSVIDGILYEFGQETDRWTNPLKNELFKLGLQGKTAYDKFIPDIYKFSSIDDRLELIRGLMDTDGTVKKSGEASFTTVSSQLAVDLIEIVRSLGGRATLCTRNRVGKQTIADDGHIITARVPSHEFTISLPEHMNPFYISRKSTRWSQKYIHSPIIKSIEPVGVKETQCILVEHGEHLYLTDDFIVTHNTVHEKMEPWVKPILDVFAEYFSQKEILHFVEEGVIEICPFSYMRGRSIKNAFIIADEVQNCTPSQVKTLLTRIGENSKMVITGDLTQADRGNDNGLWDFIQRFKQYDNPNSLIDMIEFALSDVERHPVVKEILEIYGHS